MSQVNPAYMIYEKMLKSTNKKLSNCDENWDKTLTNSYEKNN